MLVEYIQHTVGKAPHEEEDGDEEEREPHPLTPLQRERGVYTFVGCVCFYVVVGGHFILLQLCLGDGNYAPWRGECVFLLGVSVFMWLLVVVLFV